MPAVLSAVTIEAALPADAPAIRTLLAQAALPCEDFSTHLPDFLVARSGGKVVGAVGFERHGSDALLRSLVVAPDWRGDGLGGALFKRLEDEALRSGVRQFYLLTTTAEKFFARRWFRRISRKAVPPTIAATCEFTSLCPESAITMTRPVRP